MKKYIALLSVCFTPMVFANNFGAEMKFEVLSTLYQECADETGKLSQNGRYIRSAKIPVVRLCRIASLEQF